MMIKFNVPFNSIQSIEATGDELELSKQQLLQLDNSVQKIEDLILGLKAILEAVEDETVAVQVLFFCIPPNQLLFLLPLAFKNEVIFLTLMKILVVLGAQD